MKIFVTLDDTYIYNMLKHSLRLLFLLGSLLTASITWADSLAPDRLRYNTNSILPDDTTTWTGRMQRQVDSLINLPIFSTSQLGLYVRDLTAGRDLVCVNHQQRMRPASCEKLVTAIAALRTLGGNYTLRTRMMLTGEVRDSVLWGDIYFIGGMDPMLSQGEVYQLALGLQKTGIDSIAGAIFLDLTMKDSDERGWGWCWDDKTVPLRPLTIDSRDQFTQEFLSYLERAGIRGMDISRVIQNPCPESTLLFGEVTHSIDQVLDRMMKKSDNFYAESMFYQIAATSGKKYATRKEAVACINRMIKETGLNPAHYQIADGSGLSLYNYVSPELLVTLLDYAWRDEAIRTHLYPSLPIAGVDGTLEKRMKKTPAEGNVHAKTGTVDGISSLSGYATSPEGHILVFSIINQGIAKGSTGRDFQDQVCTVLCKP